MPKNRLPHRFVSFTCLLFMSSYAVGKPNAAEPAAASVPQVVTDQATFRSPLSFQMYNILAAEMYARKGNSAQAAAHYVAAAEQNQDLGVAKRAAELAMHARENSLAERALNIWLKSEPNSEDARQYRTLLNIRLGKYDEAIPDLIFVRDEVEKKEGHGFEFIVSLLTLDSQSEPIYETFKRYVAKADQSPRAQLMLATMALNVGKAEEVLQATAAVKKTGDESQKQQAARLSAKALISLKRLPEALTELEPIAKNTKNPEISLDYARLLMLADREQEATTLFKQLHEAQPENAEIVYSLSILYLTQKEYTLAEPLIKKLQQVPDHAADANYFMGQLYEGRKQPQEALAIYQQAMGGTFGADALGRVVGLLFEQKGLPATREWLQEQAKNTSSADRKSHLQLLEAQLLHEQKQYKEAVAVLNQAIQAKADDTELLYARALSQERLGDVAAAETDLKAALKLKPDDATYLTALGYMLVENTKRFTEAAELIDKALAKRPDDAAIMDSRGWVAFRIGHLDEAETWLRKAYDSLQEPEIASHLVEVLSLRGNVTEAKTILQQMLEKFPDDPMLIAVKQKIASL